jgi:hypothetical protein
VKNPNTRAGSQNARKPARIQPRKTTENRPAKPADLQPGKPESSYRSLAELARMVNELPPAEKSLVMTLVDAALEMALLRVNGAKIQPFTTPESIEQPVPTPLDTRRSARDAAALSYSRTMGWIKRELREASRLTCGEMIPRVRELLGRLASLAREAHTFLANEN